VAWKNKTVILFFTSASDFDLGTIILRVQNNGAWHTMMYTYTHIYIYMYMIFNDITYAPKKEMLYMYIYKIDL